LDIHQGTYGKQGKDQQEVLHFKKIVEHVTGNGLSDDVHIAVLNNSEMEMSINTADDSRLTNLLTCALTTITMKAAGQQMETFNFTLASCEVDVGILGSKNLQYLFII